MKMKLITKHYKDRFTKLCLIAQTHDTDKCAIRKEGIRGHLDPGHSHPYSVFYHDFLKDSVDDPLNVAEIGVLTGASLRMWREFLPEATIVGFDNHPKYLNMAKHIDNVKVDVMNIRSVDSINDGLARHGPFDLIIEDTTHLFDDQIRFINEAHKHLAPGGHMIIEDIFKDRDLRTGQSHAPAEYDKHILSGVVEKFENVFMVHLDHNNRRSGKWNNDGLIVFQSAKPISDESALPISDESAKPISISK